MRWPQICVIVWIGYQFAVNFHNAGKVEIRVEGPAAVVLIKKRNGIKRWLRQWAAIFSAIELGALILFLWWGAFW